VCGLGASGRREISIVIELDPDEDAMPSAHSTQTRYRLETSSHLPSKRLVVVPFKFLGFTCRCRPCTEAIAAISTFISLAMIMHDPQPETRLIGSNHIESEFL
jgi:hypothetical protein